MCLGQRGPTTVPRKLSILVVACFSLPVWRLTSAATFSCSPAWWGKATLRSELDALRRYQNAPSAPRFHPSLGESLPMPQLTPS